jgi:hypothetical protein
MLARSNRAKLNSGILTLIVAGLTLLTLCGFVLSGIVEADETDPLGDVVHVLPPPVRMTRHCQTRHCHGRNLPLNAAPLVSVGQASPAGTT